MFACAKALEYAKLRVVSNGYQAERKRSVKISRHAAILIGLLLCLAVFGCQTYTSGLVKSGARSDEAVVLSNLRTIMAAHSSYHLSTSSFGTFEQLTDGGYLNSGFKAQKPALSDYGYTMTVAAQNPGRSV